VGIPLAEALQERQSLDPLGLLSRAAEGPGQIQGLVVTREWSLQHLVHGDGRLAHDRLPSGGDRSGSDQAMDANIQGTTSARLRFRGQLSRAAATPPEIKAPIRSRCCRFSNRPVNAA